MQTSPLDWQEQWVQFKQRWPATHNLFALISNVRKSAQSKKERDFVASYVI